MNFLDRSVLILSLQSYYRGGTTKGEFFGVEEFGFVWRADRWDHQTLAITVSDMLATRAVWNKIGFEIRVFSEINLKIHVYWWYRDIVYLNKGLDFSNNFHSKLTFYLQFVPYFRSHWYYFQKVNFNFFFHRLFGYFDEDPLSGHVVNMTDQNVCSNLEMTS